MPDELVLLADELELLRSIAEERGSCAPAAEDILLPLYAVLLAERLLVASGGAVCITELGLRLLAHTALSEDGETIAVDRDLFLAA